MKVVEHLASLRVSFNGKQGKMRAIGSSPFRLQIVFDDGTDEWVDMFAVEVVEDIEPLPLPG